MPQPIAALRTGGGKDVPAIDNRLLLIGRALLRGVCVCGVGGHQQNHLPSSQLTAGGSGRHSGAWWCACRKHGCSYATAGVTTKVRASASCVHAYTRVCVRACVRVPLFVHCTYNRCYCPFAARWRRGEGQAV